MQPIDTHRIRFRPLREDDVTFLHDLIQDPEVIRYLMREPTPLEEIRDLEVPLLLHTAKVDAGTGWWIATRVDTGEQFGWFSLMPAPDTQCLEMGYRLARDSWGLGLATEGAEALLTHAFDVLKANSVWAQTMFVNAGSRRVLEKLSMRHSRTWHEPFDDPVPGTEFGEVMYEINRDDWLALRLP